jgi:hypothetical protein
MMTLDQSASYLDPHKITLLAIQVLRVFVNGVTAGQKGSSNIAIPDLEAKGFAQWDDTILNAIDQLMVRGQIYHSHEAWLRSRSCADKRWRLYF